MIQVLKSMLTGSNQFAAGGLLLMIIGGISVWLRAVPQQLWYWIVSQITMVITVKDDDPAFIWVKEWFLEQNFLRRIRHVDLDTSLRNERIAMMPAPGKHWFWFRKRLYEVWFSRTDNTHERSGRRIESFTFRTLGRSRAALQCLVEDVVTCHTRRHGVRSYLYCYDDGWDYVESYSPRVVDSVILEPGEKERLLEDVAQFRESRTRYQRLGVPYHRGYLLYGPPGTGKTSLVSALGAHFGMSIYLINLAEFSDRSLMKAVNDVPRNSILLFEDIDCMKNSESRSTDISDGKKPLDANAKTGAAVQAGVTLSGLLNVLDGFYAPSGVLFVMTTNHLEKLDRALLRPGRIDYKLYMGKATDQQKVDLFLRFFPEASELEAYEFVEASRSAETMAEFQGLLLDMGERQGGLKLLCKEPVDSLAD
jgi:mitochondrial chaperone BCS1